MQFQLTNPLIWIAISIYKTPPTPKKEEEKEVVCTRISISGEQMDFRTLLSIAQQPPSQRSSHVQEIPGKERERERERDSL
jgi:hypothetical protein